MGERRFHASIGFRFIPGSTQAPEKHPTAATAPRHKGYARVTIPQYSYVAWIPNSTPRVFSE
jgi:hypothetical protein